MRPDRQVRPDLPSHIELKSFQTAFHSTHPRPKSVVLWPRNWQTDRSLRVLSTAVAEPDAGSNTPPFGSSIVSGTSTTLSCASSLMLSSKTSTRVRKMSALRPPSPERSKESTRLSYISSNPLCTRPALEHGCRNQNCALKTRVAPACLTCVHLPRQQQRDWRL